MKDPTGRDADNIAYGSTLSNDRHAGKTFDYVIANPPYGKDWKRDEDAVQAEHARGAAGGLARGFRASAMGNCYSYCSMAAHAKRAERRWFAHCHYHERLTTVYWGCRERRKRDPPVHSGK